MPCFVLPHNAHAHDWIAWVLFALIPFVPVILALLVKGGPDNSITHESGGGEERAGNGSEEAEPPEAVRRDVQLAA